MKTLSTLQQVAMKAFGRPSLVIQKHAPAILTGVGITGFVATAVMVGRSSMKLEKTMDKIKTDISNVKEMREHIDEEYTEKDYNKDLANVYIQSGWSLAKLYGPAVSMGLASAACLVGAHGILKKRNASLAAAYATLDQSFKTYRERIKEELGLDKEKDIFFGKKEAKDEEGTEEETPKSRHSLNPERSCYARVFDEFNSNWDKSQEYNIMFLRAQQNYANDVLRARGHVFLNDIYDALGFPRTQAGQVVGWVLGNGDDFIDFGLCDMDSPEVSDFLNGHERAVWLDFNVDGVVLDLIEDRKSDAV